MLILQRSWSLEDPAIVLLTHRHRQLIRQIEQEGDVVVSEEPSPIITSMAVQGRKENVKRALELFELRIQPMLQELVAEEIVIHKAYIKHLIGKQGQYIAQLSTENAVDIHN